MKREELKDILQNSYSQEKWIKTLQFLSGSKNLLTISLEPKFVEIKSAKAKEIVVEVVQLGTLKTTDGITLPIFDVTLQNGIKIEYNRVGVNELLKTHILKDAVKGAIVTFHYPTPVIASNDAKSEWRFSFISKFGSDYFAEAESVETNPKKYTYIFGTSEEHRTALERLYNLEQSRFRLEDFFEAFNVEPVSNNFFKEYKNFYQDFVFHISNDKNSRAIFELEKTDDVEKDIRNFVKRLLGRLVFLYFLQKKHWLGASSKNYDDGDTNFLFNLFNYNNDSKDQFYNKWLSKLFFNALNTANRTNDGFELPNGNSVWIPFLNGGLFEEHQEPEKHREIQFPPTLFELLFKFFNGYNFTIYENSPEDHTVAVDPEMLGHIFENLLEDNKDKGAFYTPKEIVHYMTQESLIEYLKTHTNYSKNIITDLVKNHKIEDFSKDTIKEELKNIETLLDNVKICDPAIGSGAFPMGLLQEIFALKSLIHFKSGKSITSWKPSDVKQKIIQNSIYGVDIEEGAVDIARLRFWLSLVVDEPIPRALPNLDYKIMQGNSLLESYDGIDLSSVSSGANLQINEAERDLFGNLKDSQIKMTFDKVGVSEKIQKRVEKYFNATVENKVKLKEEINDLVHEFIDYNIELREKQLIRRISELENNKQKGSFSPKQQKQHIEYQNDFNALKGSRENLHKFQNKSERPYFLWKLFFADVFKDGGFDIVIGNPPYIQLQKEGGKLAKIYERLGFETFERTGDIYSLFYEKGIKILKEKGVLCYITSNKWMRASYGESTRDFFARKTNPLLLIDFGNIQVFETATVDTNILLVKEKSDTKNNNELFAVRFNKDYLENKNNLNDYIQKNGYLMSSLNHNSWVVGEKDIYDIKGYVEKQGTILKKWNIEINYGIKTGFNEAFIIPKRIKDKLIYEDPKSAEIIKPLLRGKDISAWYPDFEELWLINSHNGIKSKNIDRIDVKKDYPAIYKWLLDYEKELIKRQDKGDDWTNLRNCVYLEEFEKPKIMYRDITQWFDFSYVEDVAYANNTIYIMTGENLKYLTCVFNSKLFSYCFSDNFTDLGGKGRRLFSAFFEKIAIKPISNENEEVFDKIVDYLVCLKKVKSEETNDLLMLSYFEQIADALVFEYYFKEEFQKNNLSVFKHIQNLENLNDKEDKLLQLRKIYVSINKQENPIKQALFSMLSIPQIELIINNK